MFDRWRNRPDGLLPISTGFAACIALAVRGRSESRWRALLRWRGLRAIGRISYGMYVFHWPVALYLTLNWPFRWAYLPTQLALTCGVGAVTAALAWVSVRATAGAQGDNSFDLDLSARIAYAFHSLLFHLGKALWPAELLPSYTLSQPDVTPLAGSLLLYTAGVFALCGLAWWWRRRAAWIILLNDVQF